MLRRDCLLSVLFVTWLSTGVARAATPDPVAWWKFDESAGATAADSSGKGHGGTLENMSDANWVAGNFAGGLSFDGISQRVRIPAHSDFDVTAGGLSMMAWAKPSD
jgi:hypothetical protein